VAKTRFSDLEVVYVIKAHCLYMYSDHFRIIYMQFFFSPFCSNLVRPLKLKNCRTNATILKQKFGDKRREATEKKRQS
jgi:hypothetical protein